MENISWRGTRTEKLPVRLRVVAPTAKRFNLGRHYADNNLTDLLSHEFAKGFTCLRNTTRNTQCGKLTPTFYHYGLLELAIVPIGTTGDQLLLFQQFQGHPACNGDS
jgi:hypothetical protein